MTATAATIPFPQQPEATLTLRELWNEQREAGLLSPHEQAEAIEAAFGPSWFSELSREERVRHTATLLNEYRRTSRNMGFKGERVTVRGDGGRTESVMRIAVAGKAYWSDTWYIQSQIKQTRDLTPKDLEWLLRDYRSKAFEMIARAKWVELVLDFARKHKAKTLGDIEAKGLDLPSLDVPEEDV
ncbi:MAG: hypothetical protein NUW01_01615 [Gemmatimonadaceae bacterium]|nr:hypothetical protein [Gemmatimonadaceae bacterium]